MDLGTLARQWRASPHMYADLFAELWDVDSDHQMTRCQYLHTQFVGKSFVAAVTVFLMKSLRKM